MATSPGNLVPSTNQMNEEITIELESDDLHSLQLARRSLVGKILVSKTLNKGAVKNILLKAWRTPNEVQVTDMGIKKFLFTFTTKDEAKEVMDKDPWYVMGNIISLQYWVPQISAHEILFDRVPFWIQLYGLPLEMMTTTNAAKIMGKIGEVQEVENPFVGNHLIRTFITVKTRIDINKPLTTGCWVPRKGMPRAWIPLRDCRAYVINVALLVMNRKIVVKRESWKALIHLFLNLAQNWGFPPAKTITSLMKEQGLWRKTSSSGAETMKAKGDTGKEKDKSP
ncbi:hypothetical protein SESBI_37989 [Sesbania bispinosa]|nr:hypothetical protein SESBI_37989 [Sesbania bispinosa]